jgi:hypothetical protein
MRSERSGAKGCQEVAESGSLNSVREIDKRLLCVLFVSGAAVVIGWRTDKMIWCICQAYHVKRRVDITTSIVYSAELIEFLIATSFDNFTSPGRN